MGGNKQERRDQPMDFLLRPWRRQDAAALARAASDLRVAATLRDSFPFPYTRADARRFLRECLRGDPQRQIALAIEVEGHVAGSIGLFAQGDIYRKSAELGYWLASPYWGQGIMSQALPRVCARAFERMDICRIFAETMAGNIASRRVLERCGFQLEGVLRQSAYKNGRLTDTCLYGLLQGELAPAYTPRERRKEYEYF